MTDRSSSPPTDPSAAHRLPYSVEPRRYDLRLAPDLEHATFSGDVRITATAHVEVTEIVMNAAELTVDSASVTPSGGRELVARPSVDAGSERLTLALPEAVGPGPISVSIRFSGTLNDQLHGFYRSTFTDAGGTTRTIATTQFEATDARRAFPCFDEPDRKAVFSVTLDVPPGLAAFSNGPVVEETALDEGSTRVRFAQTIPMSSYLVAFVVGPLVATEPVDVDGVAVRVVHVPGKGDLTGYALEVAAHALRFFAAWFSLPYPAEKLDLMAIPDFAFGAMENLGCVTFREVLLLVDPQRASRLELERVAEVVCHEIAHMWFGDLVTMKWWNGIWLNEAFATFMELMCVDDFRPQWGRWVSFGMERDSAMATDALHSTRPVEYPVGPPEDAEGMFDILTYQKGAGVLRMLEQYLGPERFREGVRRYLSDHRLANTDTSDLWDAIEAASGEPVREIMDSWIFQGGFPLVRVEDGARPGGSSLLLHQQPFSYADPTDGSSIGSEWRVPVIARAVASPAVEEARRAPAYPETRLLLGGSPEALDVSGDSSGTADGALLLVNARGQGYYRVRYTPAHLERLASSIASLDPLERANLLGDTWASVVAGQSSLSDFLTLAESVRDEADPDVWARVTAALNLLDHAVEDATRPLLSAYCRALLRPGFVRLGWEQAPGEDARTPTLRSSLLVALGTVGEDREVVAHCARRQADELSGASRVSPDLASAVATVAATHGDARDFEAFLRRFRHPETPQDEGRYRYALACFAQPELAERLFALVLTEVRSQDAPYLVQVMLANRENGPATWERVRENWEALLARFPSQTVPRMLDGVKMLCRDPTLAREVVEFARSHPLKAGHRTVKQILERLEVNVAFASRLALSAADALSEGLERLGPP